MILRDILAERHFPLYFASEKRAICGSFPGSPRRRENEVCKKSGVAVNSKHT